MDGAALGPIAESVALFLRKHELIDLEEQAHSIRCRAILSVQSHYHHIVGPAMLDLGDCNERLGNNKVAIQAYEAVIADFAWFVDECEADIDAIEEDRECLDYLLQAIERRQRLDPASADRFSGLRDRCRIILDRQR